MTFDQSVYQRRRETFLDRISENGIAIVLPSKKHPRSNDTNYRYRPSSNLLYLTGFEEPEAIAVFAPGHSENEYTLFTKEPTDKSALWDGSRPSKQNVKEIYAADTVHYLDELDDELPEIFEDRDILFHQFGVSESFDQKVLEWFKDLRHQRNKPPQMPGQIRDLRDILFEMRLTKSTDEIERIKRAVEISSNAHKLAMKHCRPGLNEYQLQAIIEYCFYESGAEYPAYPIIVGSGKNATVLHYTDNDSPIDSDDIVLIDAGSEYDFYAGDITRSFPADGKFSIPQREIYEAVLKAQNDLFEHLAPGIRFDELQEVAVKSLTDSLIDIGLLEGARDELIEDDEHKDYFPHVFGHWLGMDVHDVGPYRTPDGDWLELKENMVLTVEPGLYIPPDDESLPEKYRGIGVRIEDDVVITSDGFENLSSSCPKSPDEIEQLVGTDSRLLEPLE